MLFDYIALALLWAAYCAIHSALISTSATIFFRRLLGTHFRFYRLFFNSFSLLTLIPLLIYTASSRFHGQALFLWNGSWQIVRYFLIIVAAILIFCGARHYSLGQFLGFRQIRSSRSPGAMTASGELDITGILGIVRHPWYLAVFILLWASDQNTATIVVNLVLSAYLVVGTLLEERKLVLEFGEKYKRYQERVPMFIPLKWPKSGKFSPK